MRNADGFVLIINHSKITANLLCQWCSPLS